MAKQREVNLVGKLDNVIFYNRLGAYCMRTKPVSVRRTESSIRSGLNFGKASRIGKQIRILTSKINPCNADIRMVYRLTGTINKFMSWKEKKDLENKLMPDILPLLKGFQFNDQSDLSSISAIRISTQSTESGGIEFGLNPFVPGRELHAPTNTDHILFKGKIISVDLKNAKAELLGNLSLEIPYDQTVVSSTSIPVTGGIKPGNLVIIVLSVQYMVNKNGEIEKLTDLKKLPCGIAFTRFF